MKLQVVSEPGDLGPEHEGYPVVMEMVGVFEKCLQLQIQKGFTYGDTWRSQGYMGNVARVLGKASRLKQMVWRDQEIESADESRADTLLDMINIAAFAILNIRDRNKWGNL